MKSLIILIRTFLLGALLVGALSPGRADTGNGLAIAPVTLPALATNTPVSIAFSVSGGTSPHTWSAPLVALPAGLSLNTASGALTGSPTNAGKAVIFVRVTDANGLTTQRGWNVTIATGVAPPAQSPVPPPPPPAPSSSTAPLAIAAATLPPATVGTPFSQSLTAIGGTPPYTWKLLSGGFPGGLAIDAAGTIAGTPANGGSWIYSYPFSVYVGVTDSLGAKAAVSFTMTVLPPAGGTPPPPPPPPPAANYTITVTNGTANGSASGSFAPGVSIALAAAPAPAGQYFKQWSGNAPVQDAFAPTTSFTMPATNVSVAASYYTPAPIPSPVAGHPRLWLNQGDLPRLRSWAIPSNAIYQQGLRSMLALALHAYDLCFPNGQEASPYPDSGDIYGYSGANVTSDMVSEQHALTLAFFALVDPDANARLACARKARALFMHVIDEAKKGHQAGVPFRDPIFAIYCRSNSAGQCWPLLADWLQGVTDANGQPVAVFSAQDKAAIRDVFMMWAEDCLNAYTTGGDHPSPIGVTNNPALLPGGNAARIAANNYYLNHARLITMMPLALDATDDPPIDPNLPDSARGNTLRSYLANATGAWLYQQFAMFGDPADVRAAFDLPASASVGLASGGTAPEGGLYGHSIAYLQGQLLALQTAGFTDPNFCGPQISLVGSPIWDRYLHGYLSTMVPQAQVDPSQAYLGPVYQIANFGDVLRLWITPDNMVTYTLLALTEQKQGRTDHLAAARWIALNAVEGGAAGLLSRIQRPYDTQESILYFLLFDPTDPTALHPADPRPGYAANYFDPGMGRLLARTDWTANANLFDFRSGWLSINHQNDDGGQFQFYRKGEWLTKELSNYDNYGNGQSTIWHNTLALKNWCAAGTPSVQWFEQPYWTNGSQWNNHQSAGDPVTTASTGPGYAYAQTDMTNLYNRPSQFTPSNALMDVQHASRSILWLQPDIVVVYDRAATVHSGLFKRFNLTVTATPTIDNVARRAAVVTPKGQHFLIHTLLPANATLSYVPEGGSLTNLAQLEHSVGRLVAEDTSNPSTIRFLHVLQGADQASDELIPLTIASTAGDSYQGAAVGTSVVLFPVNHGAAFNGTAYRAPATTTKHYVTGLAPGGSYNVVAASDGTTADIAIQPGGAGTADSAGVLVFDLATALQ